jgi:hypothetical protein
LKKPGIFREMSPETEIPGRKKMLAVNQIGVNLAAVG